MPQTAARNDADIADAPKRRTEASVAVGAGRSPNPDKPEPNVVFRKFFRRVRVDGVLSRGELGPFH